MIGAEDFTVIALLASIQGVRVELAPKGFRLTKEGYTPLVLSYDEFIHTIYKRDVFRSAIRQLRRVKP
jgi:hypothetical protein